MRYKQAFILVLVFSICLMMAERAFANDSLAQQRLLYQQARDAQKQGNWSVSRQLMSHLKDYPLYSYLRFYDLLAHLDISHYQQIKDFRATYRQLPITDILERRYMFVLARGHHWAKLLDFFAKEPNTPSLKCSYFYAHYKLGQKSLAFRGAKKMWLYGYSRPQSCDPLFAALSRSGHLTARMVWQRYLLAYENYQGRLQNYLERRLSGKYRLAAKILKRDDANPENLLHRSAKLSALHQQSLTLVLKRLTWQQPRLAVAIFNRYANALKSNNHSNNALIIQLVRSVIRYPDSKLLDWADAQLYHHRDLTTLQRRIRLALAQQNWADVAKFLSWLPKKTYHKDVWQYWQARVDGKQGKSDKAHQIFKKIAKQRSYYGFLSAQRLGLNYHFNRAILPANMPNDALRNPMWQQVRELMFQQDFRQAYRLWQVFLTRQSKQQLRWGVEAMQNGWPQLAIYSTIHAKAWDMLDLRFPFAYQHIFTKQAHRFAINPLLAMALARQESGFYRFAHSHVGARGLMQITTSTARHLLAKQGKKLRSVTQLYNPKLNIELGSFYLSKLLDRYQGNRFVAMAAYNAGPSRIDQWFDRFGSLPADIWIEVIPFNETRRYVKNILSFQLIYAYNSGQQLALIKDSEVHVNPTAILAKDSDE
ncbi:transglycosylase SLT domain-containing protein [Celerinatantimonas diazotrophica]|uniref:Soluble lytic murein transglycosylase n=1 Tax=Celerinatantimonas diazotrophica TaxID=412034 RepID=A0A4R1J9F1_9GAMM|nr:transglycosylase SLT domain-containing protein [Celerinatantimonas diazotrophica]TCK47235.1 soluble lytic murein transglycosylase [Celerinatantimonas diazotrophica]CAG9296007.1 Soluble lytic murein transglycosylase [Celerinatantimonas diazotrophica]